MHLIGKELSRALGHTTYKGVHPNKQEFDCLSNMIFSTSSFLVIELNQRKKYAGPGNPNRVTSQDVGQIMTACEDPGEANITYDQDCKDEHYNFQKCRRHFRDQQISQQPIENDYCNCVPTWKTRDFLDDPDLS